MINKGIITKEKTSELGAKLLRDEVVRRIFDNGSPYVKRNGDYYEVQAINLRFSCNYTEDEINQIADICVKLLDELKRINEEGYTKEDLVKAESDMIKANKHFLETWSIYNTFATNKIEELIIELKEPTRVDETYFTMVSRPGFVQGIYSVFKFIIDQFDDALMYFTALFMLVRIAMRMHSDEKRGI